MHVMSNLEYSFLANELSGLAGKHLSKVRKISDNVYRVKIGTSEILCEIGVRMHLTKYLEPADKDRFVEKVEKELDNARLLGVEQINNDRIIAFNFDRGTLVFEMFGKGNIILVRDENTVTAIKYESWSDREIKAGKPYKYPRKPPEELKVSEKYVIVSLTKLPLGRDYALEALARTKIDEKTPGNKLTKGQLETLEGEISKIRANARPYLFLEGGKPADFALSPLSSHSSLEIREMQTLSEAADEYYNSAESPNENLEKLQRRLEKQKERLVEMVREEKELKEKGDYIYEHYQDVEKILLDAKQGKGKLDKKEKTIEADI
jgi:predicted ribosome quality control (RQC) complex YloA/Tae2 family protein